MLTDILILAAGLGLLIAGGHFVVRGASSLAENFGVSPLIIGLTIVAFGTSTPELSVNLLSAFAGNTELAFGNVVGSNIANIALILGLSALIKPLSVSSVVIKREIPMMIFVSAITFVLGMDIFFRGTANVFDLPDGMILLLLTGIFLYYTAGDVIDTRKSGNENFSTRKSVGIKNILLNLMYFAIGILLLVGGGKLAVDGAVEIAAALNVPKVVIGLTVIAVGTSLPELVTSVIATIKGHTDIAIGNVVGSNIINLLFIKGLTASIKTIPVPAGGAEDLMFMLFLSLLMLPLSISNKRRLVRHEGILLLLIYFGYNLWRIS